MNAQRSILKPQNTLVFISALILSSLYLLVFFASFLAPYDPLYQNPQAGYAEPTKIYWDLQGPYVYEQIYNLNPDTFKKESLELKESAGGKKYHIKFFYDGKLLSVDKPANLYILGTDRVGRDLLSRLIYGAIPSLTIGFIGILVAFPIGVIYGAISGFIGGAVDNLMMRVAEAIMSLPSFYLLIILSAILPASLNNFQRFTMITFILSFISWASLARIIRGQILSLKEKEYIEAARSIGQNYFTIIIKHLVPHTTSFLIVAATLSVPGFIIGESALSFLGLGINQPDPSWGNILAEGKDLSNILTRPYLIWMPSLLIFAAVVSFNVLGDWLRDKFDPKQTR